MAESQQAQQTELRIYHLCEHRDCRCGNGFVFQLKEYLSAGSTPLHSELIETSEFVSLDSLRSAMSAAPAPAIQICLLDIGATHGDVQQVIESLRIVSGNRDLVIVVQGSAADHSLFADAMRAGADDFVYANLPVELLAEKLRAQINICLVRKQIEAQHRSISENHQHILHEQEMAKQVFDKVAHSLVDLANVRHWLSPIAVFNGDVLLATPTPSGGLLLLMGDFTGHGLGAAIGAIPLASTFYGMAHKGFSLQDIVKEVNKKLHEILPVGVFCCATAIHLNFNEGMAEIWNAGLPDALVVKPGEASITAVPSTALALGILSPQAFTFESRRFNLDRGDRLYFLTDGLSETENERGEQYGEQRLKQTLQKAMSAGDSDVFATLKQDVQAFIGSSDRADDISLVEVEVVTAEEFSSYYKQSDTLGFHRPVSWKIDYEFRAQSLRHQDPVPLILHALLEQPGLRQCSGQLFSIVSELFNNALDHGLLELSSELKREAMGFASYYAERQRRLESLTGGSIKFSLDYTADETSSELVVDVIDTGNGFDYNKKLADQAGEPQLHGRGLALVSSICRSLEFLGDGNHVRAHYCWQA